MKFVIVYINPTPLSLRGVELFFIVEIIVFIYQYIIISFLGIFVWFPFRMLGQNMLGCLCEDMLVS